MVAVILVIHLLVAIAMVALVLMQRSEGGALGIGGGGGGGGMAGFMTGRSAGDLLSRSTAILAAIFFCTSIALAILSGANHKRTSILDQPTTQKSAPAQPAAPATPPVPQVPAPPKSQ